MKNEYDVIIVGGGPAGLTAGIYCARANKSVLVIEKEACGGKIVETPSVENIPGFLKISGADFAEHLLEQAVSCGVSIEEFTEVIGIQSIGTNCTVYTDSDYYTAKACIIATGTKNRLLGLDGEEDLLGKSISFCVTCDGPFYKDKTVAVIGGGNSAVTEAIELAEIAQKVYIVQDLPNLTAEQTLIQRLPSNVEIVVNAKVKEYVTDESGFVGIKIEETHKEVYDTWFEFKTIKCDGVFLAVGLIPQNDFLVPSQDSVTKVKLDSFGYILNSNTMTDDACLFACGDCASGTQKQVAIACGSGATAALNALKYLRERGDN